MRYNQVEKRDAPRNSSNDWNTLTKISCATSSASVVEHPHGERQDAALVLPYELGKCLPITAAAPCYDVMIGVVLGRGRMHRGCRRAHRAPFDQYLAPYPTIAHNVVAIPSYTENREGNKTPPRARHHS